MADGKLPNFESLSDAGHFAPLATTTPPISPVAWSSFMTGVNPGKHNIFDFLNRDLRTYQPELSSSKISARRKKGWLAGPLGPKTQVRLLRKGKPFWQILGEHGVFSTVLRVPITYPPEKFYGLSLSGMCAPDLRGTQGSYTHFSSEISEARQSTGGVHLPVSREGSRIDAYLPGPASSGSNGAAEVRIPIRIEVRDGDGAVTVEVSGQKFSLPANTYSDWVRVAFPVGPLRKVRGLCRFYVTSVSPEFRMYVTPIQIDPESPAMPVSSPNYYSAYLAKLHGPFATLGLAEDTQALNDGILDEDALLEQVYSIHDERERMFFDALNRTRRGLLVCVFDASDRIQHMFYPGEKNGSSTQNQEEPEQRAAVIEEMYERMDELLGRIMAELDPETVLMVMSDHGFRPFRRGVNLNAWLRENGYLAIREDAPEADYLGSVDWGKTRAYAFGMSGLYLNREGRERKGIVAPGTEAEELRAEIAGKLEGLVDTERGAAAVNRVYDSGKAYRGPYSENGPDLIVGYAEGYRVSWETVTGRTDGPVFSDNEKEWNGDHCVDPSLVPGVFFCNREIHREGPEITDIAPTVLELFGVPVPAHIDGKGLCVG